MPDGNQSVAQPRGGTWRTRAWRYSPCGPTWTRPCRGHASNLSHEHARYKACPGPMRTARPQQGGSDRARQLSNTAPSSSLLRGCRMLSPHAPSLAWVLGVVKCVTNPYGPGIGGCTWGGEGLVGSPPTKASVHLRSLPVASLSGTAGTQDHEIAYCLVTYHALRDLAKKIWGTSGYTRFHLWVLSISPTWGFVVIARSTVYPLLYASILRVSKACS